MKGLQGSFYAFQGHVPQIDPSAFVAPGARVIGQVTMAANTSLWFNAVLRGDVAPIEIGEGSNVQDLCMLHVNGPGEGRFGKPEGVVIGRGVTVGHKSMIHGCIIEDDCLIGMNATILSGARIGRGSIVGAGAVVLETVQIPPFSMVVGNPAKVRKTYDESILDFVHMATEAYNVRRRNFREGLTPLLNAQVIPRTV
ncbi:MAG: gamma carbonic anhydrase family protein [Candidatus Lambdaproteobacteria bacterium]|nr:gamma carbonic anhydrase family protein [Candidatus Lambdaproteobacteria bacterium]